MNWMFYKFTKSKTLNSICDDGFLGIKKLVISSVSIIALLLSHNRFIESIQ
jgi:hypothetical protein